MVSGGIREKGLFRIERIAPERRVEPILSPGKNDVEIMPDQIGKTVDMDFRR